jgi:hypothetical protein
MATLQDILITDELERRRPRAPDYQAEASAYRLLAALLSRNNSTAILQRLSELALSLCNAHSAGVSVLEHDNGNTMFRWRGLAGPGPTTATAACPATSVPAAWWST